MAYITGNNLKDDIIAKGFYSEVGYQLEGTNTKQPYLFCTKCRKLGPYGVICKHCGEDYSIKQNGEDRLYNPVLSMTKVRRYVYHADDLINAININMETDDTDGHVISVNATVLYHNYLFDADEDVIQQYRHYQRLIYHLDNRQIYLSCRGKPEYHKTYRHLLPYNMSFWDTISNPLCLHHKKLFQYLNFLVVQKIYEIYGLSVRKDLGQDEDGSFIGLTPVMGFYCMKFPVMMNQYGAWHPDVIQKDELSMIYVVTNHDKKIRNVLISRSKTDYINGVMAVFKKFGLSRPEHLDSPLYFIFASILWQYGFRQWYSVEQIVEYVKQQMAKMNSSNGHVYSLWICELLRKRNHTKKKFFHRILKKQEESQVVFDMLSEQNTMVYYQTYFDWFPWVNEFFTYVEQHIDMIDYTLSLVELWHTITAHSKYGEIHTIREASESDDDDMYLPFN